MTSNQAQLIIDVNYFIDELKHYRDNINEILQSDDRDEYQDIIEDNIRDAEFVFDELKELVKGTEMEQRAIDYASVYLY